MGLSEVIKPHNFHYRVDDKSKDIYIDVHELARLLDTVPDLHVNLLFYYDLLGSLSNWKVNKKSVTCSDIKGNRIRFAFSSRYKFWISCFDA